MRALRPLLALAASLALAALAPEAGAQTSDRGPLVLSTNPYAGTPVSSYDARVSPYAADGARNPYTTGGGRIVAADGQYLGRLNANRYDPESVANPYGRYGSPYSATSINNPHGRYGSPYSPQSATNPYAAQAPRVYYGIPTVTRPRPVPYP